MRTEKRVPGDTICREALRPFALGDNDHLIVKLRAGGQEGQRVGHESVGGFLASRTGNEHLHRINKVDLVGMLLMKEVDAREGHACVEEDVELAGAVHAHRDDNAVAGKPDQDRYGALHR